METFQLAANIASLTIALLGLLYVIRTFGLKKDKELIQDVKEDGDAKSQMELKIAALEGRMNESYKELTTRLSGIENAMTEVRLNNSAFENRILSGVDKLENKIERLQDLMVKAVLQNNQNNQ